MAGAVGWKRLSRVKIAGRWESPKATIVDLQAIQWAFMFAMGIEADSVKAYLHAVSP